MNKIFTCNTLVASAAAAVLLASPAFATDPYGNSNNGYTYNPSYAVNFGINGSGANNGGGNVFGENTQLEGTATSIENFNANGNFDINGCAEFDCATTGLEASIVGTQGVEVEALTSGNAVGVVMGGDVFGNGIIRGEFAFGDGSTLRRTGAQAQIEGLAQQRGIGYGDTVTYTGDQNLRTTAGLDMNFNGSPCDIGECPTGDSTGTGTLLGANGNLHYVSTQELMATGIGSVAVHGQSQFGANMGLSAMTTVTPITSE